MKQVFNGWLFNRMELIGDKTLNHVGCEGSNEQFVDFIAQFVPEVGMRRKVTFTVESEEEPSMHPEYTVGKDYLGEQ